MRSLAQDGRWRVLAGVAVVCAVATVLTYDTNRALGELDEPEGFSVTPEGTDVPRLAPIRVTFESPPAERAAEKILSIEPAPEGQYVWASDRTLMFQPDFPGLLRGKEYTIRVAAQPEAGLHRAFQQVIQTEGLLTVDSVVPAPEDTEVPANAQVLVQFSRSVAPLTLLSEQSTAPVIEFDPPLAGKGEWLNTSLYRFVPERMPGDTTFRARIAAGLTSAADGVLKEDFTWEFRTFAPALDGVSPDAGSIYAGLRQPVTVYFNQPMDTASVEAGFKLADSAGAVIPGSIEWGSQGSSFTFTPGATLAHSSTYAAVIEPGLKSVTGGLTTAGRSVSFTTVGLPRVSSTEPANGATNAQRYGFRIAFTNPMDPETYEGRISVTGFTREEVDEALYGEEMGVYVSLSLAPSTSYTVNVASGMRDRYGQALPAYTFSFRTGARESFISLATPNQIATYSSATEPVLYFHSTNRSSATFSLHPLTPDEATFLRGRNHIPHDKPGIDFVPSLTALRTWTVPIANDPDQVVLTSTSLSGGGPLPIGEYYIITDGAAYNSDIAFSVVNTAIIAKMAEDELLAWVVDLATGAPVANTNVVAIGQGLAEGGTRLTDSQGLASFPLTPPGAAFPPPEHRLQISVNENGRYGVGTTYWQNGIQTYALGFGFEYYEAPYVGHIYTERPIYRPGETMEMKGVIRLDDDAQYLLPQAKPGMNLVITDAQGKEALREEIVLNEFGTFAASFTLPASADTGDYGMHVEWKAGQAQFHIAGTSFLVAEFRVPEFEVAMTTAEPSYASGDEIAADLDASFFFGGGVPGAVVDWSALSSPFVLRAKGYERFSFSDHDFFRWDIIRRDVVSDPVRARGTATTDANGHASFSVPAEIKGNEGAQQYTISGSVKDQTGQVVAGSTQVTVHSASFYAGIRPAEYVASAGESATIDLVTVDNDGNSLPNRAVTVKVYERTWVTTKESTPEGGRRYRSEPVDTLVQTLNATTNEKAEGSVEVVPAKPGTLRLVAEVTDDRGRTARSAAYLWVYSGEFASWFVSNDDILKLVADQEGYEVGDTAEILVPAPFEGAIGLVTVERGKIHSRAVQPFPTNSTRISIPVVERNVPNVYVSTVLYRPPTAEDPIPRFKLGYVELPVSTETRELTVDIQPDREQAQPGEKVRYDIRITDHAGRPVKSEVSVAVVDKAVLSLAEERGPTGLAAFWYERGLGVITSSSLAVSIDRANDVIAEPRMGGKGGGGLDDDRLRQDFRNTAYWDAQLTTDENGFASVEVPLPDNLTTWRMQVRAVSGETLVGESTNELLSTLPLLLRPSLPRFLRVGDEVTLRLLARNATDAAMDVTVGIEAEGVDLTDGDARTVRVEPRTSSTLEWPATVSTDGDAKLTFRATSSTGLSDSVVQELPVYLDVTPETTATGGVVKGASLFEALYLPVYALLNGGKLEVSVQPTLTGVLSDELPWFAPPRPPYDIWESTDSISARLIATVAIQRAEQTAGTDAGRDSRIKTDLAELLARQAPDGGWRWCRGCRDSSPWISAWALLAIGEAERAGHSFDQAMLQRAESYITTEVNRPIDVAHPRDPNEKAFFLYSLSVAGAADTQLSTMRALFEQYRSKLTPSGRAYLLLGMAEAGVNREDAAVQALANDLTSGVIPSANGNHWEEALAENGDHRYRPFGNHTSVRSTALVLLALAHTDPTHPLIEETARWLMVARGAQGWQVGLDRAQAVLSLSQFAAGTGELGGDFTYQVLADQRELLAGRFSPGASAKPEQESFSLTEFEKGKVTLLSFLRNAAGSGRMYYSLNLRYMTPAKEVEALSRGISVSHEYTSLGDPATRIDSAKVGDVVRVKVTVMTSHDRNYVTVDDFLPAAFEPIDPQLKITDPALVATLNQERLAARDEDAPDYWAPWHRWYYTPFQQVVTRDDRVTLRAQELPRGVHEYIYYVRATSPGDFFVAPALAEESFFPEVFGRSDSGRFTVTP
ncbi:MAG: Ig-like domain-containing protein [Dehalococcoidia bacterium]